MNVIGITVCFCSLSCLLYIVHMAVSRLFRCKGFIPGPLHKRGPMGPKGPMGPSAHGAHGAQGAHGAHGSHGPMGPHGPHGPPWAPRGQWGPVYVAFTQRCWGKGTNEKHPYINICIISILVLLIMYF